MVTTRAERGHFDAASAWRRVFGARYLLQLEKLAARWRVASA